MARKRDRETLLCAVCLTAIVLLGGYAKAEEKAAPRTAQAPPPVAAPVEPPVKLMVPVWYAGGKGALRGTGAGTLTLTVTDYAGKNVWIGEAKAGEGGAVAAEVPVGEPGYYTLNIGGGANALRTSFAVVPASSPGAPAVKTPVTGPVKGRLLLGVNTHFGQRDLPEGGLEVLKKMGLDAVRDEIGWGANEKEKGVFSFLERHKTYTRRLKEAGIPLLWSHSYGNVLYNEGRYPDNPAAAQAYGRYAAQVLKHSGDNILAVEILNEPNKLDPVADYLPILRSAHRAIRGAGFRHEIISVGGAGPAGGGMSPGFAAKLFEAGGAKYCDSFSQHPYMTPFTPDLGYAKGRANLDFALNQAGNVVKKYDLSGSWITEQGWPALEQGLHRTDATEKTALGTRAMVSESKQAAFTARTLLGASRYPHLKGIFLYDFQDDGPDPLRREHRFGLVRQDLTPKPAYVAFAVAAHFLKEKTFVRRVAAPDSLLTANFYKDGKGELWAAVWALETTRSGLQADKAPERHMDVENRVPFRVKGGSGAVSGYDWQGRPVKAEARMTATALPLYLRVGSGKDTVEIEKQ